MKYLCMTLFLLLFASASYAGEGGIDMLVVDTDPKGTNVRESPGGKVAHVIPFGGTSDEEIEMRRVTVKETKGQWFRVRLADDATGWMHTSVLGSCASATEDGDPPLYEQMNDSGPEVARLKEGTKLRLLSLRQNWVKVETVGTGEKKSGWMMGQALFSNPFNSCW
jgi:SH3-like domain-containing protein